MKNVSRFYRLDVQPDLFRPWCLVREWGRIGSPGSMRLRAEHVPKIARVLAQLGIATGPDDMDLPGFQLHPLTGSLAGFWSVTIRANWRIIFRFDEHADATDVDYINYH